MTDGVELPPASTGEIELNVKAEEGDDRGGGRLIKVLCVKGIHEKIHIPVQLQQTSPPAVSVLRQTVRVPFKSCTRNGISILGTDRAFSLWSGSTKESSRHIANAL